MVKKHKDENVLFVTHLDPIKAAISVIANIKPSLVYNIHIPNASINIFKKSDEKISLCGINILEMERYLSEF
jgi:probable phosphoglycerate mutase